MFIVKKATKFSLTSILLINLMLFAFLILYANINANSTETKQLSNCLNQVLQEHSHSVWTLLTDEVSEYIESACKLIRSIQKRTSMAKNVDFLILEMSGKHLSQQNRQKLVSCGWKNCQVERIAPRLDPHPRFKDQFTKLALWSMTEYKSVVYFDSDCLAVDSLDYLFNVHRLFQQEKHKIGVARDFRSGWVDTFNMGVFVLKPNSSEYKRLVTLKNNPNVSYEVIIFHMKINLLIEFLLIIINPFKTIMAEQGFMNEVYRNQWFDIGFEYNANLAVYGEQRTFWDSREKNIKL